MFAARQMIEKILCRFRGHTVKPGELILF
jgi:hypothetical protein